MTDDRTGGSGDWLIELKQLTKRYRHRKGALTVLDEVELRLGRGDMVAIMGASGAGKSTLLQILGTLDEPTEGKYIFDGEDVFKRGAKAVAKFRNQQIGFVFQFHHLLPEFTALENVMMPGLIGRHKKQAVESRAQELLELVGLKDRVQHQPGELSGGEQQRVAIARALFMEPKLLLADEPTGNLDLATSGGIHKILKDLNDQIGITIVIVTHDPRLADQMPIQLLVDEGKIIPFHKGDERIGERLPVEMLSKEPTRPLTFSPQGVDTGA